jgi:hypothetical protein
MDRDRIFAELQEYGAEQRKLLMDKIKHDPDDFSKPADKGKLRELMGYHARMHNKYAQADRMMAP